jgi:hypothetical protein
VYVERNRSAAFMTTQKDFEAMETYRSLMIEAKARSVSIETLANDQRGIPSPLVREYGFLQLRMLCEIVALGCLVAHGDLVAKSPKKLTKAYVPGEILTALERLHDDFFPVPINPQRTENGWHMADYNGGPYLRKSELSTLWAKCGDVLHRGSLRAVLRERNPIQSNFADLSGAAQKLLNLLSSHRVITSDRKLAFLAFLKDSAVNGGVRVILAEAQEGTNSAQPARPVFTPTRS